MVKERSSKLIVRVRPKTLKSVLFAFRSRFVRVSFASRSLVCMCVPMRVYVRGPAGAIKVAMLPA
jgi:hypothetical protein